MPTQALLFAFDFFALVLLFLFFKSALYFLAFVVLFLFLFLSHHRDSPHSVLYGCIKNLYSSLRGYVASREEMKNVKIRIVIYSNETGQVTLGV